MVLGPSAEVRQLTAEDGTSVLAGGLHLADCPELDSEISELSEITELEEVTDFSLHTVAAETAAVARNGRPLRALLVSVDLVSAVVAWVVTLLVASTRAVVGPVTVLQTTVVIVGLCLASLLFAASQKLYWARVCAIRTFEVTRVVRVALMTGVTALVLPRLVGVDLRVRWVVFGTVLAMVLDITGRGIFCQWLRNRRLNGRYSRAVALIGDNDEAQALVRLVREHPECGLRLVGVIGRQGETRAADLDLKWLGTIDDLPHAILPAGGAIVAASAFSAVELNRVVRHLLGADLHVHMSSGLAGMSFRRLRPLPIAGEPLFYIEKLRHSDTQRLIKRVLDIVLSSVLLVLSLPVFAVAAAAIKLSNRRAPVIYRQERIGRGGHPFTLYKLRTMDTDAASRLSEVQSRNQRTGPLFKLAGDPRVTRVGRLLRQTSLDEVPQLLNVLKGDMSLVGPRPALAHEVAEFDAALLARHDIAPGLTGLWQVEARDNPSFHAYRRLDLFYLENWSLLLDIAIIYSTVMVVAGRFMRACLSSMHKGGEPMAAPLD